MDYIQFARTDFSVGESVLSPEAAVEQAKSVNATAIAVADTMTLTHAIRLTAAAEKAGIKPLIGARIRVVENAKDRIKTGKDKKHGVFNRWFFVDVYVVSANGFKALCKLLSLANTEERYYYHARLELQDVLDTLSANPEDLAVVTTDINGYWKQPDYESITQALVNTRAKVFLRAIGIDMPVFDRINNRVIETAATLGLPVVYGSTAMHKKTRHRDKVALGWATGGVKSSDPWRLEPEYTDTHAHDPVATVRKIAAMAKRLPGSSFDLRHMFTNHAPLCAAVGWSWKTLDISLPAMSAEPFKDLADICREGFKGRLTRPVLGYQPPQAVLPDYVARLKYELSVLKSMGFETYFLLVHDLVKWSKQNDILVGPGRGSVGGSLVAFLMGITDVDPIRFGLIFERFINPDRLDLPDADLDFMSTRRHEVIEYLTEKYGGDHVAGIANYSYLGSSSSIRDAGRIYDLHPRDYAVSKAVPKVHNSPISLEGAYEAEPQISDFAKRYPHVWKAAVGIEGSLRGFGQHAAGVVVAGDKLSNRAVVERRGGTPTICWDKRTSEDAGLVKLDVLGLSTLDTIRGAEDRIREKNPGFDIMDVELDDQDTLREFGQGNTAGVFQFESHGMRGLLKSLSLSGNLSFDDLAAATALYRPGPMDSGLMEQYVNVRQGMSAPEVLHPSMNEALAETHGVMVYQEQVMQIARDLSGFSMAESDKLRKAMGKKDADMMATMRDKFVSGATESNAVDERLSGSLFDQIAKFAGYAFNKSHAVEYTIISFWSMYIKVHYPQEFFAAALTTAGDADKIRTVTKDAAENGIAVLPPDVNVSTERFECGSDRNGRPVLMAPLSSLKGLSAKGSAHIVEVRGKKPGGRFASVEDFESSVLPRSVNKKVRENLQKIGAYCSLDPSMPPPNCDSRTEDQIALLPGVVNKGVKADRGLKNDTATRRALAKLSKDIKSCQKCDLCEDTHLSPRMGKAPKVMVVLDCASSAEVDKGKLFEGPAATSLKSMLAEVGLSASDVYVTTIMKVGRQEEKFTNDQWATCKEWIEKEFELVRPPVVLTLGTLATRHFLPDTRGSVIDTAGRKVWRPEERCMVVSGFSPGMLYYQPELRPKMIEALSSAASMVSNINTNK